jgi:hypothetical protein
MQRLILELNLESVQANASYFIYSPKKYKKYTQILKKNDF